MNRDLRSGLAVAFCGFIGIIMAMIENQLYTQGTLIDEFITGSISIADLMTVTIIVWLLIGVFVAVLTN